MADQDKQAEPEADEPQEAQQEPKAEGRLSRLRFTKKKDMPGGLWLKCESCSQLIYRKELESRGRVCPACGFHFTLPGRERVAMVVDEGSWEERFGEGAPQPPLQPKPDEGGARSQRSGAEGGTEGGTAGDLAGGSSGGSRKRKARA